jgi:hypothetical protein
MATIDYIREGDIPVFGDERSPLTILKVLDDTCC